MAALGDGALSARRRPAEHHPVGHPGLLRSRALSLVSPDAPHSSASRRCKTRPPPEPSCGSVGSMAFLVPAMPIAVQCLTHRAALPQPQRLKKRKPIFAGAWQACHGETRPQQPGRGCGFVRRDSFSLRACHFLRRLHSPAPDEDELVLRARQQAGNSRRVGVHVRRRVDSGRERHQRSGAGRRRLAPHSMPRST